MLPRGRVGEPEVRAAVDDQGVGAELFGQRRRMPVRQGQKHHVMAGEHGELGGLEHSLGQRRQVRMVLAERAAGAGRGGQRADGEPAVGVGRMPEQQPQDLTARIAAGTGNRHLHHVGHSDDSAWLCSSLQIHSHDAPRLLGR